MTRHKRAEPEREAFVGIDSPTRDRLREEALRPFPALGYDHEQLALYLIDKEAFELAESELRRAVWLNPFEPRFAAHLAWCLCRRKRYAEADEWLAKVPAGWLE